MVGGRALQNYAMVNLVAQIDSVKTQVAMEASAPISLQFAITLGGGKLIVTDVMIWSAISTTNARVESAMAIIVDKTASTANGRIKNQAVHIPDATSTATALVTWSAEGQKEPTATVFFLTRKRFPSQTLKRSSSTKATAPRPARSFGKQKRTGAMASFARLPISAVATGVMA